MSVALGPTDRTLLNGWQRAFPLSPRPFAEIADIVGLGEQEVLARFASLKERDLISRIGAVVRPNTVGASTLAAMAVPPAQLENVVRRVNAEPTVNHNYEREHRLNLWFVVTALDRAAVQATIARLSHDSGLDVLDLPLERAYHIDLGFDLEMPEDRKRAGCIGQEPNPRLQPDADDCKLLSTLEDGLRLVPRPYAEAAQRIGWRESGVTVRLARLVANGIISRFGVVVKHRSLGYRANAMAVWDVPDAVVDRVAEVFTNQDFVTLCYRRPRRLPHWPYNLFCMVHGRDRTIVADQIASLNAAAGTTNLPQAVLFSTRCFKQRGARFSSDRREAAA